MNMINVEAGTYSIIFSHLYGGILILFDGKMYLKLAK